MNSYPAELFFSLYFNTMKRIAGEPIFTCKDRPGGEDMNRAPPIIFSLPRLSGVKIRELRGTARVGVRAPEPMVLGSDYDKLVLSYSLLCFSLFFTLFLLFLFLFLFIFLFFFFGFKAGTSEAEIYLFLKNQECYGAGDFRLLQNTMV